MGKIFFLTLTPDDYHGAPMVQEFTDTEFPLPSDKEDVFDAWRQAGYNSYSMGDFESEEEAFEEYGNYPCFYATYIIYANSNDELISERIIEEITDVSYEGSVSVEGACNAIREVPGVIEVIAIDFGS